MRRARAIDEDDSVEWKSPLQADGFVEYRDGEVLRHLGVEKLPNRSLAEFWPRRGPVWDALGCSKKGRLLLVEAKAHIPEAASPPSQASPKSLELIEASLAEARRHYAPKAKADWSRNLYQYANRLAFLHKSSWVGAKASDRSPERAAFGKAGALSVGAVAMTSAVLRMLARAGPL